MIFGWYKNATRVVCGYVCPHTYVLIHTHPLQRHSSYAYSLTLSASCSSSAGAVAYCAHTDATLSKKNAHFHFGTYAIL